LGVKAAVALAVVLAAGCAAPGSPASFADALGMPGCDLRHPDGSDDPCKFEAHELFPAAAPPAGWVCLYAVEGPGYRHSLHRSVLTGNHGIQFEDRNFASDASGLVTLDSDQAFLGRWSGTNAGFVDLGRALGDQEGAALFVYTLKVVAAEGEASRAAVRERWSTYEAFPWLAYDVTLDGRTYTRPGMASGFPIDLDVSNEAGRLATSLAWNGGYAFGPGLDGCTP
jgi:hypothetical protein